MITADDEQLFQHESAIREVYQTIFEMASSFLDCQAKSNNQTGGYTIMEYRKLGHTGLAVSNLALGTMYFGSETSEARRLPVRSIRFGAARPLYRRKPGTAGAHRGRE
jgi:hypothetical protein